MPSQCPLFRWSIKLDFNVETWSAAKPRGPKPFETCAAGQTFCTRQTVGASLLFEGSLNSKLPTIWRVEKQMKSR